MGEAGAATSLRWCRWCGQHVEERGAAPLLLAVHAKTGLERGSPDGHLAAPLDFEPALWRWAREIAVKYKGAFRVTARLGILRADWANLPPGTVAEHYTARDRDGLVAKLDAALGGG